MPPRQVAVRLKSDGKAELRRDLVEVGDTGKAAFNGIADAADAATLASDRQLAAWRKQAAAAREAGKAAEEQRRINALLGVDRTPARSARDSADAFLSAPGVGLSSGQQAARRQLALYTASDVISSAASGMNPAVIALQQGPQVLQQLALEGGNASASLLRLGAAIGVPTAAIGLLAAAGLSASEANRKLELSISGLGAASGVSAADLSALADANHEAGQVSAAAAREMAGAYAETGKIGRDVIGRLIVDTRAFAAVTSQDAKAATAELAKAFADPAKGADALNAKLGFLDDGTYRYIQTLLEQNRVTDAQLVLSGALSRRLETAASSVSALGRAWDGVKAAAIGAWDAIGRAVDRAAGGAPRVQRVAELLERRADYEAVGSLVARQQIAKIDAELAVLRRQAAQEERRTAETRRNLLAAEARAINDRVNPNDAKLRQLRADQAKLQEALSPGVLTGRGQDDARKALVALGREIRAVEAGYSSAAAQASALGRQGRSAAAEARRDAQEAKRAAEELARNLERQTDLRLRDSLAVARLADNKVLVESLETETRLRSLISDYQAAGFTWLAASLNAQRQIGAETKAEYETRRKMLTATPEGFVSTEDLMRGLNNIKVVANDNAEAAAYMKASYASAFDLVADRLVEGQTGWSAWRNTGRQAVQAIIGDLLRLSAINPLRNLLFGSNLPTLGEGGGLIANLFSRIPKFASGTDSAPGGLAYVHKDEVLVDMARGTKVIPGHAVRAMGAGRGGDVSVPVTIVLDARGAGPNEVEALKAEVANLKRSLPGMIVETVSDAHNRRWLRTG